MSPLPEGRLAPMPTGPVVLLGPQTDRSQLGQTLNALGVRGRVALITAGWQEYELEDEALAKDVGRPVVNLTLHGRAERVFGEDREYAHASAARQKHLQHLQEFYRVRLDALDDAARAIAVRHVDDALLAEQEEISIEALRHADSEHLARCEAVRDAFEDRWGAETRPHIMAHRAELARALSETSALVIAGGHIMSLLNRLRLFAVLETVGARPIVAISAGAMTLTDRIVLFHDSPPYGKNLAQLLDAGIGLCPGVVAMPDASRRVHLDDVSAINRFARRMAPATCLMLDPGSSAVFVRGDRVRTHAARLGLTGVERGAPA